jgi:hypothetical protein
MADNFIQQQTRLRQRREQRNQAITQGAPFLGYVTGDHDPRNERVTVQYHGGERKVRSLHPYVGSDSWIRTGQESSTAMLMAQRPDSNEPEQFAYAQRNPEDRVAAFESKAGLYRPLNSGEIEIHSRGAAQAHFSRRPRLEQRAGLIRDWIDQDRLESGARSPTHTRQLHLNRGGLVGDEERIGVVTRPDDSGLTVSKVLRKFVSANRLPDPLLAASFAATAATSGIVVPPGPFAKEHMLVLNTGAAFPEKLLDIRQGDVIDDQGNAVTLPSSGKNLRYKGEWFAESVLGGVFFVGIDDQGNFSVGLPSEASVGGDIKIPAGDLLVTIGKAHGIAVQTDYNVATAEGQMTFDAQTGFNLNVPDGSVVIKPSATLDVGRADEPAVLGAVLLDFLGQLLDVLVSHLHTGNMGAPTPLDPGSLANLNKLKADFVATKTLVSDYINFSKAP